ncbi:DUF2857 domain-containing protein [Pseudomonas sp. LRF_L74]|uniref:DUF2857 domain-containing protein n=1 Tax=Pseudomonas sp. LRF_L74 TaxID=3369422 RepID=UPI003F5D8A7B
MISQVLHEIQNGNFERCFELGWSPEDLRLLQSLPAQTIMRLSHSSVMWVEVNVDSTVLRRLADQAAREEAHERTINRALHLGASTNLMYRFFGLSHSETAARRRLLNIDARRGRPTQLSEEQEIALWKRWVELKDRDNNSEQLDLLMILAEEQNLSLTAVWHQIMLHSDP